MIANKFNTLNNAKFLLKMGYFTKSLQKYRNYMDLFLFNKFKI